MTSFDDLPDLLTVEEYGAFVRRGKNQAYEDVREGRVPHIRLGRHIRIPKAALAEMMSISPVQAGTTADG